MHNAQDFGFDACAGTGPGSSVADFQHPVGRKNIERTK
jgi:hypothetical protein